MTAPAVHPGDVNAHTHLYSGLTPLGMPAPNAPPANFVEILERVWWRLDRALDPSSLRASVRYYAAEALRHGTTTLVDHHESPNFVDGSLDVIADACAEIGVRVVVCYGATERNRGRQEAKRGLAECARFARTNERPLARALVGLHASFTVSDETLREAGELCSALGLAAHVHCAEDGADVEDARRRGYAGPLERLLELGALPEGSLLAHGVHLDERQVEAAEARGLWFAQNPRSNEGNHVGYARSLHAARRALVGTDGFPADLRMELAALHRLAARHDPDTDPDALDLRLEHNLAFAAAHFGADAIARDRVTRDVTAPGAPVAHVVVDGRVVVDGGRLVTADEDEIRAQARIEATRLWKRMVTM